MTTTAAQKAQATWIARVLEFESDPEWRSCTLEATRRTLLTKLNGILNATPPNILQMFDGFSEEDLQKRARGLMNCMMARKLCTTAMPVDEILLQCAAILRALDELLLEDSEHLVDEAPECWLTSGLAHYVIPIPRAVMREGGPRTGQIFSRRGILQHRVIPAQVVDVDILVHRHPDVSEADAIDTRRTIGCAIFDEFTLAYEEVGQKGFIVTSVECAGGMKSAVAKHCAEARDSGCDVIVWPELTMHPDRVEQLRRELSDAPLRTSSPPIVVAGSWHVEEAGAFQNIAPVLDGRGGDLASFGKSRRFSFCGREEAIAPYGRVNILATDRELIAFGICKDFCDKAKAVPLTELDVDLVLVPSMGRPNTMTAHRDAADDMKVAFGSRSVVAQQTYPREAGDADGYILKGLAEPREAELGDLVGRSGLTTFQCQGKMDPKNVSQA